MSPFDQLFFAIIKARDFVTAEAVIAAHPTVLQENGQGTALFESAAHKGAVDVLAFLFDHGVGINATLSHGLFHSPLVNAASDGHYDAVLWLIEHGAEINTSFNEHRYPKALVTASHIGHFECVKLLVERGAELNACWAGKNALSLAMDFGQKKIVKYLRSQGAKTPTELEAPTISKTPIKTKTKLKPKPKPKPKTKRKT